MDVIFQKVLNEPVNFNDAPLVFFKGFDLSDTWVASKPLKDKKDGPCTIVSVNGATCNSNAYTIRRSRGRRRAGVTCSNAAWCLTPKSLEGNEFFHELGVSMLVCRYLSDLPAYSKTKLLSAEWKGESVFKARAEFGNSKSWEPGPHLYFSRVKARELEDELDGMTAPVLESVIKQVLVAIRMGQLRIKLKHHDLHLGNVLVEPCEDCVDTVETPEGVLQVPVTKFRAVIIDYGLSSAVDPETNASLRRLDESLIMRAPSNESASSDGWGVWGHELAGDEGYDVAMFTESLVETLFMERPLDIEKLKLVATLQHFVNIDFTDRGRPAERCGIQWAEVFKAVGLCV